ncbi:MAG: DUF2066 domain-containing protein [Alcanivorax sp.]
MYRLLLALIVGFLCASPVFAADAGEVSVPLQGEQPRGAEAREQALRQGLETIIRRVTGRDQVADLPGVAGMLEDPSRWLMRYAYEGGTPPRLRAVFDDRALVRHLSDQGAPVWSGERPPVLVWLVSEGAGRGRMVAAGDSLAEKLTSAAARRGVALTLPEWDQRDRDTLAVADIRGRFDGPLLQASCRYDTDWIATAVLYDSGRAGAATLNWRLLQDEETVANSRDRADDSGAALDRLVDVIADRIAERYSVGSGTDNGVDDAGDGGPARPAPTTEALVDRSGWITVRGVRSLSDWQRLRQALADLGPMRSVALRVASDDRVQFEVDFAGGRSQLIRSVTGVEGLSECDDPAAESPTFCFR